MDIDYSKKSQQMVAWIKKTVQEAGFSNVVIALSGGIDSAVSATLAVRALGKEHVHVLLLPYGSLNNKGTEDAKKVATFLGLAKDHVSIIDIEDAVDEISHVVRNDKGNGGALRKGNIMARVRMIYLYDFAKMKHALVVGTENKSEYYLSYFTRFGDEASDIEPIRSLYKTQVWEMAKVLGIPQEIIAKAPSAELWESQTDEKEFGFSYKEADRVLFHYFDEGLPEEGIIDLGIPKETVQKVLAWVEKNDFKHHLPYIFEDK